MEILTVNISPRNGREVALFGFSGEITLILLIILWKVPSAALIVSPFRKCFRAKTERKNKQIKQKEEQQSIELNIDLMEARFSERGP
ncbi:MAG: hypothetical protein LBB04_00920 [Oscillospiraceae bacterium]|nr:hypothetical protein [Oscillospiraceae bacterium]